MAHRSGRLGRDIGTQGGDEQPVRVHAIWRARHQGDAILACDDSEFRHIGRFDHADTVDPVSEGFPHHRDTENVARLQFVETGEHQCFDQTPVTGDDRMRIGAADRQAAAVQVSRSEFENGFRGAVVDGKVHADFRNDDRAHDPIAGIELRLVCLVGNRSGGIGEWVARLAEDVLAVGGKGAIVRTGLLELALRPLVRPAGDFTLRTHDDAGLGRGGPCLHHQHNGRNGEQLSPHQQTASGLPGSANHIDSQNCPPLLTDTPGKPHPRPPR